MNPARQVSRILIPLTLMVAICLSFARLTTGVVPLNFIFYAVVGVSAGTLVPPLLEYVLRKAGVSIAPPYDGPPRVPTWMVEKALPPSDAVEAIGQLHDYYEQKTNEGANPIVVDIGYWREAWSWIRMVPRERASYRAEQRRVSLVQLDANEAVVLELLDGQAFQAATEVAQRMSNLLGREVTLGWVRLRLESLVALRYVGSFSECPTDVARGARQYFHITGVGSDALRSFVSRRAMLPSELWKCEEEGAS